MSEENNKMIFNFMLFLGALAVSEAGLEPKVEIFEISSNRNGKGIKFRPLNLDHKNSQLAKYLLQNSIQPKEKTQPLDIDINFSEMAKFLLPNSNEVKERVQSPLESESYTPHAKFLYQKGNQLKDRPLTSLDWDSAAQISKMLSENDALKEKPQSPRDDDSSSQLLKLLLENNNQQNDKVLTLDLSDSSSNELPLEDGNIIVLDADALLGKISNLYKPKRNYEDEILATLESKILNTGPDFLKIIPSKRVNPGFIPYRPVLHKNLQQRINDADSTSRPVHYRQFAPDK